MKYKTWTLIQWDGNPELNYMCWRKSFRKGHVSIGVGSFFDIVYSFGANSDESRTSTRWRKDDEHISEVDAMIWVDKLNGYFGLGRTENK